MATITINGNHIDPDMIRNQPTLSGLEASDSASSNYILIQLDGPLTKRRRELLKSSGVQILEYVPKDTYICYYESADLARIRRKSYVRWANVYMKEFKIPSDFRKPEDAFQPSSLVLSNTLHSMSNEPLRVQVVLHNNVSISDAVAKLADAVGLDPQDIEEDESALRLVVQPQNLKNLAEVDDIRHIEAYVEPKLLNDVAVQILEADVVHSETDFRGAGQVIAVCDTGFDKGSTTDVHPDFTGRVKKLYALGRSRANDPHGHGTHVAGSALSDGFDNERGKSIRGTAPEAELVMQSVLDNQGRLGGLPNNLERLFQQPYDNDGARVHNNSWGANVAGKYTQDSLEVDRFVWNNRDMVICFAAGNEGTDSNRNGMVDYKSINSPGTAKNCITVGATENNKPEYDVTYGQAWPGDFPVNPIAGDRIAQDPEGMAAFSSRGPTEDGRYKPDVVAPGTQILSSRSRDSRRLVNGSLASDQTHVTSHGTSMATPFVAGCAAVVREFFLKQHNHQPSAALVKAMLINGAVDIVGQYTPSEAREIPNYAEGFGRVNLARTVGPFSHNTQFVFQDEDIALDLGDSHEIEFDVPAGTASIKATLVWTDPPGEALQNDLDLVLIDPAGEEWHGNMPRGHSGFDRTNNVEQINVENFVPGRARLQINAFRITSHLQSFAVVLKITEIIG